LNELFLWKSSDEASKEKVADELADIFSYAILLSEYYNFDIIQIVESKLAKNASRYPVEKSRGVATKYNQL
jgi:NTP pyrophosphatase (non-canonical NTP hydrolase)